MAAERALHVWLVAGEESGDQLGASLMRGLKARVGEGALRFSGVGGHAMEGEGLKSLFPLADVAVMGFTAILARFPTLYKRVHATVDAAVAANPDILVIIDSPEFTHQVAKRVRKRAPSIPIVDYVSPSVWAWRPGRAAKMRAYVDHILALLPFEPAAHERLGGPPCTYVGHPLVERVSRLRPAPGERAAVGSGPFKLLVLPGSRRTEITRLMEPFGETVRRLRDVSPQPLEVMLPAVAHLAADIEEAAKAWPVKPQIVHGEEAKWAAFRSAHGALAASGTVTLELALAGVPMVVGYRLSRLEEQITRFIKAHSIVLANLVLAENVVPEFIQDACNPETLASTLLPLMTDTPERRRQIEAFERLDGLMIDPAESASERSARIVLEMARRA
jgi:lipid-A-disaccharide synthase